MDKSSPRSSARALRTLLLVSALALLWLVCSAQAPPAQAAQVPGGLTFMWTGGGPPGFMCVGDSEYLMFQVQFASDPRSGDPILAPLVPPGQASRPQPAGGSLDLNVTLGKLSQTAWKLDFRTGGAMSGSVTYTADKEGSAELIGTLRYSDGNYNYTGSVPPIHIRIEKCDYKLKITLRDNRTISGMSGDAVYVLEGEGGFKIRHDARNSRGNIPFTGNGSIEVTLAPFSFAKGDGRGYITSSMEGRGTLKIVGELLEGGSVLDMFLVPGIISMSGTQRVGESPEGSRSYGFNPGVYMPNTKCLDSLQFPHTGGTQSCSESYTEGGGLLNVNITAEITVSWEE